MGNGEPVTHLAHRWCGSNSKGKKRQILIRIRALKRGHTCSLDNGSVRWNQQDPEEIVPPRGEPWTRSPQVGIQWWPHRLRLFLLICVVDHTPFQSLQCPLWRGLVNTHWESSRLSVMCSWAWPRRKKVSVSHVGPNEAQTKKNWLKKVK